MEEELMPRRRSTKRLLSLLGAVIGTFVLLSISSGADAFGSSGANFIATGHDMDYHCSTGSVEECEYLKIVVDKVRNGSTLPILALDQGAELSTALADAGFTGTGEVVTVNPGEATAFNATAFVNSKGEPLYSAIITASDETCGGCDDNETGENNINARAPDFATYFNAGGGILALAGANRYETYYNFVPLKVGATVVSPPFEVTPEGEALGITSVMANCCATHNSFDYPPPSPLVTLEKDTAGKAETIAAFDVKITEKGFSTLTTKLSGEGQSAEKITVKEGASVTDTATLTGEHAGEAEGTVEYKLYSDNECKSLVAGAGKVSVADGVVPPSSPETLAAGTYYWQADYSGDLHNKVASSTCGEEVETVEKASGGPTPTSVSTILSGGGQSGATIKVTPETAVTDAANLTGTNASSATGKVTYKVYSDSGCTTEVASAGEVTVSAGTVPMSNAETLAPGIYYWQASYGGDGANVASKSPCGSEVETVEAEGPPPHECRTVVGSAMVVIHTDGETERLTVTNKLSTKLTAKQKLVFGAELGGTKITLTKLTSASCTVGTRSKRFVGKGEAEVNGEAGYRVAFYFILTTKKQFTFHIVVRKPKQEGRAFRETARKLTSEKIS